MKDASKGTGRFFIFFCEQRLVDQFFRGMNSDRKHLVTGQEKKSKAEGVFSCWKRCVFFFGLMSAMIFG